MSIIEEIHGKLKELIDTIIPEFKSHLQSVVIPDTWKKTMQTLDDLDKNDQSKDDFKEVYPNLFVRKKNIYVHMGSTWRR
ncbi:MAG: hypothetical protein ACTSO7_09100 [Candidatus Heimdallarchaeota archaeon]